MVAVGVGCGKPSVGDPCATDTDCPSGLCLTASAGFPNGYCSSDCATASCPEGESCMPIGDGSQVACLRGCTEGKECRDGTQCYQGTCQPRCTLDADCRDDGSTTAAATVCGSTVVTKPRSTASSASRPASSGCSLRYGYGNGNR